MADIKQDLGPIQQQVENLTKSMREGAASTMEWAKALAALGGSRVPTTSSTGRPSGRSTAPLETFGPPSPLNYAPTFAKTIQEASHYTAEARNASLNSFQRQISKLEGGPQNDLTNSAVRNLRDLVAEIGRVGKQFDKVSAELKEAEQTKNFNVIAQKSQELTSTTAQLKALHTDAGYIGGMNMPSGGGFLNRAGKLLGNPFLQGGAAALGAGYSAIEQYNITANRQFTGSAVGYAQNLSDINRAREERQYNSVDMTNPENIMRYRGDVLFKHSGYLGFKGRQKAIEDARKDSVAENEADLGTRRHQLYSNAGGLLKSIGIGVAVGAAAGSVVPVLGTTAGAVLGGATAAISGGISAYQDYYNNPASLREGGITGDPLVAANNQAALLNKNLKNRNALQDAEIASRPLDMMSIKAIYDAKRAQYAGVALVGSAARTSRENIEDVLGTTDSRGLNAASRLGLGIGEFSDSRNQVSNVLGVGRTASVGDTSNLLTASKSGLGGMDDFLSAITSFNKSQGGGNNIDKLTSALSAAVSIGFDKSSLSKQFVQGIAELARSTRSNSIADLSTRTAATAQFLSPNGVADEKSLATTMTGMQNLEDFSRAKDGTRGNIRAASLIGAGVSVQRGAAIAMDMGVGEDQSAIAALKADPSGNSLPAGRARDIFIRSGRNATRAIAALQANATGSTATLNGAVSMTYGASTDAMARTAARQAASAERAAIRSTPLVMANAAEVVNGARGKSYDDFRTKVVSASMTQQGMTYEGANAYAASAALSAGLISPGQASESQLRGKMDELAGKRQDFAAQNLQKFISGQLASGHLNDRVGLNDYKSMLQTNSGILGFQLSSGQRVSPDLINDVQKRSSQGDNGAKKILDEINQSLSGMSRLDVVQAAEASAAQASGEQAVRVMNFPDLAQELRNILQGPPRATPKADLNTMQGSPSVPLAPGQGG